MNAQDWERDWWGKCQWTLNEELKQLVYARKMGLGEPYQDPEGHWPVFDVMNRSIADIGGGPSSLLLKCTNLREGLIVDPCPFPGWVFSRYETCGIAVNTDPAEEFNHKVKRTKHFWDEAWIYNVLQHVDDPAKVIANARRMAKKVRIFDWIEIPAHTGHPHMLTAAELDEWFGSKGFVEYMNESGCVGKAYYGVFDQV